MKRTVEDACPYDKVSGKFGGSLRKYKKGTEKSVTFFNRCAQEKRQRALSAASLLFT